MLTTSGEGRVGTSMRGGPRERGVRTTRRRILCLSIGLVSALLCGCDSTPKTRRVLIVGIDGATLEVIEPMMREGRLPNLARIASDGAYGVLQSSPPLKSPRIWTTIATGKIPSHHGITDFTVDTMDGRRRLVASSDRRGHALWNIASDRGLRVATVNWWVTHPPERIEGVMVSDHFLPSVVRGRERFFSADGGSAGPVVHPANWAPRIARLVASRESQSGEPGPFADAPLPGWVARESLESWYRDDASVGRVAVEIAGSVEPDLLMVLFKGVDAASHVLYATLFPDRELPTPLDMTDAERAAGREILLRFYEQSDALLGRLLEFYGRDDLVLVVSDHGFQVRSRFTDLTGGHKSGRAAQGILFARGDGIEAGSDPGNVRVVDVTPTVLHWLDLPVADDMDGTAAAFLHRGEAARIASYDGAPIERLDGGAGAEAEIMRQLEALGYFENETEAGTFDDDSAPANREPDAEGVP